MAEIYPPLEDPDLSGILETEDLNRPSNDDGAYLIQDVF